MNSTAEARIIDAAAGRLPPTRASLAAELAELGVVPGMTILVHTALSRLGWIVGGPQAVAFALLDATGAHGTVVMPTQSGQLSDPATWQAPPVPAEWWPRIRDEMPAYDPATTPTRGMGAVPELFRTLPGALRSGHPLASFAALGGQAAALTSGHEPGDMFGETSPLARLYAADARVLLLGIDHAHTTALHLAEHRARYPGKHHENQGAPVLVDGRRRWLRFRELATRDDDFATLGEAFAQATGQERRGVVGWGEGRLAPLRALVDFAVGWMESHR